ncbi:MAG: phosphoenolpyruvate--protein phosphotransferase [Planctomycetes bacterium]|nr:phosphoenolpyruvate--protein phosphotransferase [Planctomycetota bacterium]
MEIKKGIAVSPGIAISKPFIIDSKDYRIPRRSIAPTQVDEQIKRIDDAFSAAEEELTSFGREQEMVEESIRDIFAVHLSFLRDESFKKQVITFIKDDLVTAEYAVSTILREAAAKLAAVEDSYISERAADIYDIEKRLLTQLLGKITRDVDQLSEEVVIIAHDLTPTQTASLNRTFVKGFATDSGGRTSHTAIVARCLAIPAVVALEDITSTITSESTVIIDGNRGVVIIDPDEDALVQYERYARDFNRLEIKLKALSDKPAITRDGVEIELLGNIEFPGEAHLAVENGAGGIGLYRSEFLYLYSGSEPTEEDHYEAYSETVRNFKDQPIVIRTMDLGGDKLPHVKRSEAEGNPVLGLKSIRYCLQNLTLFKTQLRAILRASVLGDVRIMFPMITNLQELRQAKMILRDVMEDLDEYAVPYNASIPIGAMIETPSAALMASLLAKDCDFFSVGTNDLIQYTLAVDRANERVSSLYSVADPAVLRLLRGVIHDAHKAKIALSVCGEVAGDPEYIMLLLGMGVRSLSLAPPMIPEIKQIIRSVTIEECNQLARKIATMDSQRQIKNYVRDAAIKILPEAF